MNETEKMEIAAAYITKMRRLMLYRVLCVAIALLIGMNMKKLNTEIALLAFGVFGIGAAGLSIYSQSQLFCPFCGERFKGYVARKYEIIPEECPNCNEKLKY